MALDLKSLDGVALFSALIHHGSFTQVALVTGHSKSYISKEITKLEARLGVRLLNRTTRSLNLTPEGEFYYQHCQQIMSDIDSAQTVLAGQQQEPQGRLKVGSPLSFGLSRLRPILSEFMAKYPKVELDVNLEDRTVDMISEGFDVLIRASSQLEDSSLIARKIMASEGVTIASPKYLARCGTPQTPMELPQHTIISYSYLKSPNLWPYISPEGKALQVKVNSQILTNSPELELSLCLDGQGITRLPRFNLNGEIEQGRLVELFPEYGRASIDVYIIYPSRQHLSAKVRCFVDFIVSAFDDI